MILLDTHAVVWSLNAPSQLSATATAALADDPDKVVCAASLYEIRYKNRLGKWPEVDPLIARDPPVFLAEMGLRIIPVDGRIMDRAASLDWPHRDPFDRIIAATALQLNAPILSRDATLDTLPEGPPRIW